MLFIKFQIYSKKPHIQEKKAITNTDWFGDIKY
jgi:hypothetical protein